MTVAKNLYGGLADQYVLGVYRADEDNAVASGEKLMTLRPVRKNDPSFAEALMNIDSAGIRRELLSSILNDVLARAEELLEQAKISNTALGLYLDALQTAQSHCVRQALSHFPVDRVTKHFVDIWLSTDPPFIKAMRKTGHIVELPFKIASRTAKTIKDAFAGREKALDQENFGDAIKEDLLSAVNRMRYHTLNPQISVLAALKDPVTRRMSNAVDRIRAGKVLKRQKIPRKEVEQGKGVLKFIVPVHPVVFPQQEAMKCLDWKSIQESILSQQEVISEFSVDIEKDLEDLANGFRREMGMWTKIRQMFASLLNVVPATAAITYILSTGDPVGAVGIKVKLTGLFGLHDLYALIAIPATSGLKRADQAQLKEMLGPIIQTWLNSKLNAVKDLFEKEITGNIIRVAEGTFKSSGALIQRIDTEIANCRKVMTS